MSGASLAGLLFDAGPDDEPALHCGDTTWTRGELRAQASDVADALRRAGVGRGDAVGVMLADGAEPIFALFGVWKAGAVYVPMNPRAAPPEVHRLTETLRPRVVLTDPAHARYFGGAAVVRGADGRWNPGRAKALGAGGRHERDVALIQLTSGTTGRPKPVPLRHSQVRGLLDAVVSTLRGSASPGATAPGKSPGDARRSRQHRPTPNLVPVSLSLWAGIYQVLFAMRVGAEIVVMATFATREFAHLVHRFSITSTVLPPPAMTMLADDPGITDLSPLRFVRSITAPLSPVQARRFQERFSVAVLNGYGQTELGGEVIGWSASDLRRYGDEKLGAVGLPHEGVSVKIVDGDGAEVAGSESGELWVRTGATVEAVRARARDDADGDPLAGRLDEDGWFRTGDVAHLDEDGFVWIDGRVSDMINRGGLKVFPEEVAEVLRLAEPVIEAAVVGVPDDRLGEVPWAFVVAGSEVDASALERVCREHLAPYKVPVRFEMVDALPRNEIGKVVSSALVARALATR